MYAAENDPVRVRITSVFACSMSFLLREALPHVRGVGSAGLASNMYVLVQRHDDHQVDKCGFIRRYTCT